MDARYKYDGIELAYSVEGEGDTVMLLHGWGCDRNIWVATREWLKRSKRVVTVDFAGFGLSDEPREVWGVEEYTRSVSRPYLETHHFGIYSTNHCGFGVVLSREIFVGRPGYGLVRGVADCFQPCADELLFLVRHAVHGHCLRGDGIPAEDDSCFLEVDWCAGRCGLVGRLHQPVQPLPYLRIQQGIHAWQERTGEGKLS